MKTIRLGDKGDDVKRWQSIVGVTPDGSFGPATKAATMAWQSAHKLVPDGVVGPATWSAAGVPSGNPSSDVSKDNSPFDSNAFQIVQGLNLPREQAQYLVTVARGEGHYGKGWGVASPKAIADAKALGISSTFLGVGSNNWGAVQGEGDAGSFAHVDYHRDGTPYIGKYKRYSTPEKGASDMARVLLKSNVNAALAKGDLKGAVYAQHANGYFELDPAKYLEAVKRNYAILRTNLNWPNLLERDIGTVGNVAIGLLLAGAGYAFWRAKRG